MPLDAATAKAVSRINAVIADIAATDGVDAQTLYDAIFHPFPSPVTWALNHTEDFNLRDVCLERIAQGFPPRTSEVEQIARIYLAARNSAARIPVKWAHRFVAHAPGLACNTEFGIVYAATPVSTQDMHAFYESFLQACRPFVPHDSIYYLSFAAFEPCEWWQHTRDGRTTDHARVFMLNCINVLGAVQQEPFFAVFRDVPDIKTVGAEVHFPLACSRADILGYWFRHRFLVDWSLVPRVLLVDELAALPDAAFHALCASRHVLVVCIPLKIAPYFVALDMTHCQLFRTWFREHIPGKSLHDYIKGCVLAFNLTNNKRANRNRWPKVFLPSDVFLVRCIDLIPREQRTISAAADAASEAGPDVDPEADSEAGPEAGPEENSPAKSASNSSNPAPGPVENSPTKSASNSSKEAEADTETADPETDASLATFSGPAETDVSDSESPEPTSKKQKLV